MAAEMLGCAKASWFAMAKGDIFLSPAVGRVKGVGVKRLVAGKFTGSICVAEGPVVYMFLNKFSEAPRDI